MVGWAGEGGGRVWWVLRHYFFFFDFQFFLSYSRTCSQRERRVRSARSGGRVGGRPRGSYAQRRPLLPVPLAAILAEYRAQHLGHAVHAQLAPDLVLLPNTETFVGTSADIQDTRMSTFLWTNNNNEKKRVGGKKSRHHDLRAGNFNHHTYNILNYCYDF